MKLKKWCILNNLKEWGKEGLEFWWPTLVWINIEINSFEYFKFCIDFHDLSFEFRFFGVGFNLDLWRDKDKFYFWKSKADKRYKRIQIAISCAMYWHFFQAYNDDGESFVEIFGFRFFKKEEFE